MSESAIAVVLPAVVAVTLQVTLPIRTFSEGNRRGHWAKGYKQTGDQRATVAMAMRAHANAGGLRVVLPAVVKLTRCAPRMLDRGDNLAMSCKHVRDGIADWLGVNDRDHLAVRYEYEQERSRTYGVRIEVSPMEVTARGARLRA